MAAIEGEQKNIPIKGIIRAGSDNLCVDGAMNEVIGMEYKDGSYVPYSGYYSNGAGLSSFTKMFVHKTSKQDNQIGIVSGSGLLYWRKKNAAAAFMDTDWNCVSVSVRDVKDVTFIGNTLCANTPSGVHVFNFDGTTYKIQKNENNILDFPQVRFRVQEGLCNEAGAAGMQILEASEFMSGVTKASQVEDSWNDIVNTVSDKNIASSQISKVRGVLREKGGLQGFFYVCYAYRLKNGNLVYASAPMLMCPVGFLQKSNYSNNEKESETSYRCALKFDMNKWNNMWNNSHNVSSSSRPGSGIQSYDGTSRMVGAFGLMKHGEEYIDCSIAADDIEETFSSDNRQVWLHGAIEKEKPSFRDIYYNNVDTETINYENRLYQYDGNPPANNSPWTPSLIPLCTSWIGMHIDTNENEGGGAMHLTKASRVVSGKLQMYVNPSTILPNDVSSICVFISPEVDIYRNLENDDNVILHGPFLSGYVSAGSTSAYNTLLNIVYSFTSKLKNNDEIRSELIGIKNLYKVKEIYRGELSEYNGKWVDIDLKGMLGETLYTLESLPSTAFDYTKTYGKVMSAYNYRLHLANIKRKIWEGYDMSHHIAMSDMTEKSRIYYGTERIYSEYFVNVYLRDISTGEERVIYRESINSGKFMFMRGMICYPDINAYKMEIVFRPVDSSPKVIELDLIPNENLGFAFYISPELSHLEEKKITDYMKPTYRVDSKNTEYCDRNVLHVSDTAYPTYFPQKQTYNIGDGEIIGFARLSIALSQDNFGKVPLLVFTTDGIYGMEVNGTGDGAYSSVSPFSREVCINTNTICELDGSVLFASDKGLMIADQQGVHEFVPQLNGEVHFLPNGDSTEQTDGGYLYQRIIDDSKISELSGKISLDDFRDYLRDSNTTVSYVNKKNIVLIYNKKKAFVYWIDIKTRITTKLDTKISFGDDNYPNETYYTKPIGEYKWNTISFQNNSRKGNIDCLLQSRPIKIQQGPKSSMRVLMTGFFNNTIEGTKSIEYIGARENDIISIEFNIDDEQMNRIKELVFVSSLDKWRSDKGVLFTTSDIVLTGGTASMPQGIYPSAGDKIVIRSEGSYAELIVLGSLDAKHWQLIGIQEKELFDGFHNFGCVTERVSCNYIMILFAGKLSPDSHIDSIDIQVEGKYNNKLKV